METAISRNTEEISLKWKTEEDRGCRNCEGLDAVKRVEGGPKFCSTCGCYLCPNCGGKTLRLENGDAGCIDCTSSVDKQVLSY